jgi:hypothetical protein
MKWPGIAVRRPHPVVPTARPASVLGENVNNVKVGLPAGTLAIALTNRDQAPQGLSANGAHSMLED